MNQRSRSTSQPDPPRQRHEARATEPARPPIPPDEERRLWVRSGGRCAICNKYLLDDQYFVYDVSTGEMAHIVGWKNSKRSPRGDHPLPESERNKADNLILLCPEHHQLVDKSKLVGDFTVERLRALKKEHEDRIYHLTGLGQDRDTAVVRVLGGIRGAAVELSAEHVREVVLSEGTRYPRFPLVYDWQGAEIDLRALPDPEQAWGAYWHLGKQAIDQTLLRVDEGVRRGEVRHLSVFALARIPLLVYLGYRLDDKIPTRIYQKHRGGSESWAWPTSDQTTSFQARCVQDGTDPRNVALLLSLSGSLSLNELPAEIDASFSVFEISPAGSVPSRDILKSRADLDAFARSYHYFLSGLELSHKQAREIRLFAAVPVAAAVVCGRGLMRDTQPMLTVYDRTGADYRSALTVNAP